MMPAKPGSLLDLIMLHLGWYPLMEPRDVYKLLYQGVMGAEHLLISAEEFTRCLQLEYDRVLPDPQQQLLEPIRGDGDLFRVNLRPYKARHLPVERLSPSLVETAKLSYGTKADLRAAWLEFVQHCQSGQIAIFDIRKVQQLSRKLEPLDYPPIHHSVLYSREYQPAYRLIAARFLPELGLADAG